MAYKEEKDPLIGKGKRHRNAALSKTGLDNSKVLIKPEPYSTYDETERQIAKMLTENTGTHVLDSGGAFGRKWQENQGRDFITEPVLKVKSGNESDDNDPELIFSYNVFHYLSNFVILSFEAKKLQKMFFRHFSHRSKDDRMVDVISRFTGMFTKCGGCDSVNTYNYNNLISQNLRYVIFDVTEKGRTKNYIIIEIHGGADIRMGYTAPQIFEIPDLAGFNKAQSELSCSCNKCHMMWNSEDCGDSWTYVGNKGGEEIKFAGLDECKIPTEFSAKKEKGEIVHKKCGGQLSFWVMEDY